MSLLSSVRYTVLRILLNILVEVVNKVCDCTEWLTGWRAFSVTEEEILKRLTVTEKEYLYHDRHIHANFQELVKAIAGENLTPCGRASILSRIVRNINCGIYFKEQCSKGSSNLTLQRPIFLIGTMRSGTTLLHNLLNCDDRLYCQTRGQMIPANRKSHITIGWLLELKIWLQIRHIHIFSFNEVEDILPLAATFMIDSLIQVGGLGRNSFKQWWETLDTSVHTHFYKILENYIAFLKLNHSPDSQRVVINQHLRLTQVWAISKVFPDAIFIHTVREPKSVVASISSLFRGYCATYKQWGPRKAAELGKFVFQDLAYKMNQFLKFRREKEGEHKFVDVQYKKLASDTLGEMERLYSAIGIKLTATVKMKMATYLSENKQHKHGKHTYSLEEFGVDPNDVDRAFKVHKDFFKM